MGAARYSVALLDLDGTLVDSARGITATLAFTLERMGVPIPAPSRLIEFVGPPILDGFRDLVGLDPVRSQEALAIYRERYQSHGAFDAEPYPGVDAALEQLREAGLPLAVATSKPERQARRILTHFGLIDRFVVVAGASEDERRSEKADVITWALEQLRDARVDVAAPVMVGDRVHDVAGAAVRGIPSVFAAWGYGAPEEAAGTVATAGSPAELPAVLLRAAA